MGQTDKQMNEQKNRSKGCMMWPLRQSH